MPRLFHVEAPLARVAVRYYSPRMRARFSRLIFFGAAVVAANLAFAQEPAFDPKAAAFIHKEGKTTIEGHAFLRRPDNAVENAVGQTIRLIPVTPYSEARLA